MPREPGLPGYPSKRRPISITARSEYRYPDHAERTIGGRTSTYLRPYGDAASFWITFAETRPRGDRSASHRRSLRSSVPEGAGTSRRASDRGSASATEITTAGRQRLVGAAPDVFCFERQLDQRFLIALNYNSRSVPFGLRDGTGGDAVPELSTDPGRDWGPSKREVSCSDLMRARSSAFPRTDTKAAPAADRSCPAEPAVLRPDDLAVQVDLDLPRLTGENASSSGDAR